MLLLLPSSAWAASFNDSRASGAALASGAQVQVDTTGNTVEPSEPNTVSEGCATSANRKAGATAWYTVTGTGGPITITTDEPTLASVPTAISDTIMFVYTQGSNTSIACNDDIGSSNLHSTVTFPSTSGQVYEVQVGTCCTSAAPGGGLVVTNRPANDNRAFPTPVATGVPVAANNDFATSEPSEVLTCQRANGSIAAYSRTVWFRYTAPASGQAIIRTNGGLDTVEAVYQGDSPTPVGCNDDEISTLVGPSGVTINVTPGDYLIQVGGFAGNRGAFTETVDFTPTITASKGVESTPSKDVDGDGYIGTQFGGPDCNDNNAGIHPTAVDIPHDGIDQNCDGQDATYSKLKADASVVTRFHKRYTQIVKLPVSGPIGASVVLMCSSKKRGCELKRRTFTITSPAKLELGKYLKTSKLTSKAKVTVTVTKSGFIGKFTQYKIRLGRKPKVTNLCLEPGSNKPQQKCS
jgi:hypothetical protein